MFEKELRDAIQLSAKVAADRFEEEFPDICGEGLVDHFRAAITQSLHAMCEIVDFKASGAFPGDLHVTYYSRVR